MHSKTLIFISIVIIGFLAWFLVPYLTGKTEPWDSGWYVSILLFVVLGLGFFIPSRWWLWPIGLYLGQIVHLVYTMLRYPSSEAAAWWFLGFIVLTASIIPLYILCAIGRSLRGLVT